jgi:predicted nucleotidyltransferase
MATPTRVGPGAAEAAPLAEIRAEVARACRTALGSDLRAVVLTGSLARGEGSFVRCAREWQLRGDVDVLAVLQEGALLPQHEVAESLSRDVADGLRAKEITAEIGISIVPLAFLRRLQPHMFAYELRECGEVLDGDRDVLALIPGFTPADVPLVDGFRTLCNRIIEQLDALAACDLSAPSLPQEIQYGIAKFYLEMATSLLLFLGEYAPTYRARAERLQRLAAPPADLPLDLVRFTARVAECTALKLHPADANFTLAVWLEAIEDARALWRWQLQRLRAAQHGFARLVSGPEGIGCESFAQWLRGWLHLLRYAGWHKSWRSWPRWLRLCRHGSPRYLIYAAAARLFFAAPQLILKGPATPHSADVRLPRPLTGRLKADWRESARDIARAYFDLLVNTRS